MTQTDQLGGLIASLIDRTQSGSIAWAVADGGFELQLANGTRILLWEKTGDPPGIHLSVFPPDADFPVALAMTRASEAPMSRLRELYEFVRDGVGSKVLADAQSLLDSDRPSGVTPPPPTTAAPRVYVPSPPTREDQTRLFDAIRAVGGSTMGRGRKSCESGPTGVITTSDRAAKKNSHSV